MTYDPLLVSELFADRPRVVADERALRVEYERERGIFLLSAPAERGEGSSEGYSIRVPRSGEEDEIEELHALSRCHLSSTINIDS
jgi:hypothetical protein